MRGPPIPWLLGFKHYSNNRIAGLRNSDIRIPQLLGFKNYLNNCLSYCCTSL